ncbi:DUF167 domain-containing protein [Chloroflexota bacterium]
MSTSANKAKILLRVYPGANKKEVTGFTDGVLRLKVSTPPIRGKANKELIAFLSQLLGIGKGNIDIIKGHTTRNKVVSIDGLNQKEVMKRLLPG